MLGIVLALVGGCGSTDEPERDPARPFEYQVWFDSADVPLQTELSYNGEVAGRVTSVRTWEAGTELSFGNMTLPMNWDEDPEARLGLQAMTPCGPVEVPLELDGVPTSMIKFKTPSEDVLPKPTLVYQEWGRGVAIGQTELLPAGNAWTVPGLDCAPEHDVSINGEVAGRMTTPSPADHILLAPPDQCFVFTTALFGEDGGGTQEVPLSGAWAYGLEAAIEHPFRDVPTSIRTDRITASVGVVSRYLTEVPCGG